MRKRVGSSTSPKDELVALIENKHITPVKEKKSSKASDLDLSKLNDDVANFTNTPSKDSEGSQPKSQVGFSFLPCLDKEKQINRNLFSRQTNQRYTSLILLSATCIFILAAIIGKALAKTGIMYKGDGYNHVLSTDDLALPKYKDIADTISHTKSYAIVINTFKRPDMLKLALDHWVNSCGTNTDISQVFVVWAELDKVPPKLEDVLTIEEKKTHVRNRSKLSEEDEARRSKVPTVEFIRVPKDSLNSRFLPIEHLSSETDAVFMVDDDVRIDCQSIQEGFEAWRHYPDALVGYYPRIATPKLGLFESKAENIYHTWPIVFMKQKFNIILTKASFFHKKYLDLYHNDKENPKEILEYVDANKNCEDVAMAFLVARKSADENRNSYCKNCPLYVHGKIQDMGLFNGISTSGGKMSPSGHMEKRSMCLDAIKKIYEDKGWDYPLFDVPLGEQSWKHKFWWQNGPSNFFEWFSVGNSLM